MSKTSKKHGVVQLSRRTSCFPLPAAFRRIGGFRPPVFLVCYALDMEASENNEAIMRVSDG